MKQEILRSNLLSTFLLIVIDSIDTPLLYAALVASLHHLSMRNSKAMIGTFRQVLHEEAIKSTWHVRTQNNIVSLMLMPNSAAFRKP